MILYFSGTGNTRAVAERLAALLGDEAVMMSPLMRTRGIDLPADTRRVIWCFPVYSWGVPPYVVSLMRNADLMQNAECRMQNYRAVASPTPPNSPIPPNSPKPPIIHHAVMTCGDDCGLADLMWRRAVRSRGRLDGCVMSVQMPNNYVCLPGFDVDSKSVENEKLDAFPARVAEIAETVKRYEASSAENAPAPVTDIVRGSFAWFKTRVIYPWFVRNLMSPKLFKVSVDTCVSCGRCATACPLGNITMNPADGNAKALKPSWGDDCAACLGCYHSCPVHAISFTRFTRGKGQYLYRASKG